MSILDVKNLSHTFGDKKLFSGASMQLFGGDKMGLCGLNGVGKSTFMGFLTDTLLPDEGYVKWNPRKTFGYLDQQANIDSSLTVREYLRGAFDSLYRANDAITEISDKLGQISDPDEMSELLDKLAENQALLDSNNFYEIDSNIEKVTAGLGVTAFGLDTQVGRLSGGQRAKVMLSKLLLESPDVFLLDEPTNFLDHSHIEWLERFLSAFKGTFIIISHDAGFLDRVVNCVCDIEHGEFVRFNGTYSEFLRQKSAREAEYEKNYTAQKKQIAKLETFVEKNIARASTSKMAKSRRKQLEKIEVMQAPSEIPTPTFEFSFAECVGHTALWVNDLEIGYSEPLLPEINLMLTVGEKLAVTGFNGIGKTTFLKTLCGIIPALSGTYKLTDRLIIGYYEQEHIWQDSDSTAIQFLHDKFPRLSEKEIRSSLSRCGLKGDKMGQKLSTLSGGEQAKVKIAALTLKPCGLLVLDEPTNHLDTDAVAQLIRAIKSFKGSVIFVSHSEEFTTASSDRVFSLENLFD